MLDSIKATITSKRLNMIKLDPRHYQLLIQIGLLIGGASLLEFTIPLSHIFIAFITGLVVQTGFTLHYKLPRNLLSTINSTLSILLLLHANNWIWIALASFIAISSKFLIRYNNKHLFNPSNIGIVVVLLLVPTTWADPGQWGQTIGLILLLAGTGLIALIGFSRMLTSLSFLIIFIALTFLRALWLGDPVAIPLHQLQSGAMLIFTFFMLSDPITTPNHPIGRIIFGLWVGITSWVLQYQFYIPNAFLYALALSMPLVLLLNNFFHGHSYHWPTFSNRKSLQ